MVQIKPPENIRALLEANDGRPEGERVTRQSLLNLFERFEATSETGHFWDRLFALQLPFRPTVNAAEIMRKIERVWQRSRQAMAELQAADEQRVRPISTLSLLTLCVEYGPAKDSTVARASSGPEAFNGSPAAVCFCTATIGRQANFRTEATASRANSFATSAPHQGRARSH